jgi:hypothetical protein
MVLQQDEDNVGIGGNGDDYDEYAGKMDEFRVYNYALKAGQVSLSFTHTKLVCEMLTLS